MLTDWLNEERFARPHFLPLSLSLSLFLSAAERKRERECVCVWERERDAEYGYWTRIVILFLKGIMGALHKHLRI